ncbi:MAG: methyltransferase domain-containing protein [Bacteroidetes bacterium]|nr:methyltransferase domain-containing protein [Bacteroidota bacterium]
MSHTTCSFEEQYLALRAKENWLSTDDEVKALPVVSANHPHYKEWKIRARSANRLMQYLRQKKRPLRILETGCGNGWLSNQLALIPENTVTGADINTTELQQAKRVFGDRHNLVFTEGDIRQGLFKKSRYDIVVFAASIQYFSWFGEIIHAALELTVDRGEVHIMDSPFYAASERKRAAQRSASYFTKQGFPEMNQYYFHQVAEDLEQFNYRKLYDPHVWHRKLIPAWVNGTKNPFPWICIRNQ